MTLHLGLLWLLTSKANKKNFIARNKCFIRPGKRLNKAYPLTSKDSKVYCAELAHFLKFR